MLRAAAALAVLAGHAYLLAGRQLPVRAQNLHQALLENTGSGVILFFGISGYVISRPFVNALLTGGPRPQTATYALRRAFRIYPLYWIALTAVILITGRARTATWQLPFHYLLLQNLVPGQEGSALFSVSWTLTIEVLFYISVPLIAAALARHFGAGLTAERLALLVLSSWVASIIVNICGDLAGANTYGLWLRTVFPAVWQLFCPGLLLAILPHLTAPKWRRWSVLRPGDRKLYAIVVVALLAGGLLAAVTPRRFGTTVYLLLFDASRVPFAIGYGVLLALAIGARPARSRWMLELGLASYGIYLLHPIVLAYLLTRGGHNLVPLAQPGLWPYLVHVAVLAGSSIPLAVLSWHYLERPAVRIGAKVGNRLEGNRPTAAARVASLTMPDRAGQ